MARRTSTTLPLLLAVGLGLVLIASAVLLLTDASVDEPTGGGAVVLGSAPDERDERSPSPFGRTGGPAVARDDAQALAPEPPPRLGPLRVAGRVFDRDTGDPIPVFQVSLLVAGDGDPIARLEEVEPQPIHQRFGVFSLERPAGRYDVVIQAPGYVPGVLAGVIVPAKDGKPEPVGLSRGPAIAGLVLGDDGYPRAGLPVFLEVLSLADPGAEAPRVGMTKTGADGGFSFSPLPDGEYAVTALEPGNTDDRVGGIRVYGRPTPVTIRLTARHQISFRVQDIRGQPVDGARLELRGPGRLQSGLAGRSGLVVLDNVSDGTYRVAVQAEGYVPLDEELVLAGGMGDHARWLVLDPLPPGDPPPADGG